VLWLLTKITYDVIYQIYLNMKMQEPEGRGARVRETELGSERNNKK
jgi:hypothetical protein